MLCYYTGYTPVLEVAAGRRNKADPENKKRDDLFPIQLLRARFRRFLRAGNLLELHSSNQLIAREETC